MESKLELYNRAKAAYYAGKPIMEDFEFDDLEQELGLDNHSYVGTRHNLSHTIEHPYIMGSLSKIQIKKDKDNNIDWNGYLNQVKKYFDCENIKSIITPKFDGCSFEITMNNKNIKTISSRGDGNFGKDIYHHLIKIGNDAIKNIELYDELCLRGEVLIDKNVFKKKYSEFVNPRSFVAGILNRDYDENDDEMQEMLSDLSIVIYDIRMFDEGNWVDLDWIEFDKNTFSGFGYIDNKYLPDFYIYDECVEGVVDFENIYHDFEDYRNNKCRFALDGIVFKPIALNRINNLVDERPEDCVAIKFIPVLEESEIVDIEWNLGKTGEYTPVVITKPVIMDGKKVTRAKAHNIGFLIDNHVSKGVKIILSLAGDIIPFIYKITDTTGFNEDKMNIPENCYIDGCHLIKNMTSRERAEIKFIASAESLNIPYIGPAVAKNIFNYISSAEEKNDESSIFFGNVNTIDSVFIDNILLCNKFDIYNGAGEGKNGERCMKAFDKVLKELSLADIIDSCNFRLCGKKLSAQIANYLTNKKYDFTSMPSEGYKWAFDKTENFEKLISILTSLNKSLEDFIDVNYEEKEDTRIPVILTGEPNDYTSKAHFLNCHPEYRMTGSWKEVQIVFTNSLTSNTGKMKKAREKNIEIKLY